MPTITTAFSLSSSREVDRRRETTACRSMVLTRWRPVSNSVLGYADRVPPERRYGASRSEQRFLRLVVEDRAGAEVDMDDLEGYHRLEPLLLPTGERVFTKSGVRGYPGLPLGITLLLEAVPFEGRYLLDATGGAGMVARRALGWARGVQLLEPSRAALRCARRTLEGTSALVAAGVPWEAPAGRADLVCLAPPAERGSARVHAEVAGAWRALRPGGTAYLLLHKDRGAKRYERGVASRFGRLEVVARGGGWRLSRISKQVAGRADPQVEPLFFTVGEWELVAFPGVFAAGKLDPGTEALLAYLPRAELSGRRVLDLGCGYGMLALWAARAGARVVALDDDWAAVRSAARNADNHGLRLEVRHSDIDSALRPDECFEMVLMNPPFHVGRQVRLEVPRAFVTAAYRRLVPGGSLFMVANQALPYEPFFRRWRALDLLLPGPPFKVLRAVK